VLTLLTLIIFDGDRVLTGGRAAHVWLDSAMVTQALDVRVLLIVFILLTLVFVVGSCRTLFYMLKPVLVLTHALSVRGHVGLADSCCSCSCWMVVR